LTIPEVIEFFSDLAAVGDSIGVTYERGGLEYQTTIILTRFYPTPRFVLIVFFVGIMTWVVAVVILWNAKSGLPAIVLHWTLMALAVALLLTYGPISADSVLSYVIRLIFMFSYPAMAVLFFYFTLLYPTSKIQPFGYPTVIIFGPFLFLVAGLWFTGVRAIAGESAEWFEHFQTWFDYLHISLLVYTAGSVAAIVHSIRRSRTEEERKRLAWIVLGAVIGVSPFLLYVLVQILWSVYLFPEEYVTIFLLAIPFSFAISLLRHHFLGVWLLVSRGPLHVVLTSLLTVVYLLVVLLVISVFVDLPRYLFVVSITLVVALLFNPLRIRAQRVIDDTLFAARVRFRRSIAEIGANLQQSLSAHQLFERLVEGLSELVPAETLAVYRYAEHLSSLHLEASSSDGTSRYLQVTKEQVEAMVKQEVLGLKGQLDPSRRHQEVDRIECLEGTGFGVCVPLTSDNRNLLAAILIRSRGGTDRLQEEELDLLISVTRQACEILERLALQEQIILEGEERRRLQELSNLKSDFVSYVSHELRTPLTSIGMFTEFLFERLQQKDKKSREYLRIIQGEAGRLGRMVSTILNAAKFDSEGTIFRRERRDLVELVRTAYNSMRYQLEQHKFRVTRHFPKQKLPIDADADNVILALTNLISNAIKYSPRQKSLTLSIRKQGRWAVCEVRDRGMGISPGTLPHVFQKYYRAPTLEPHSKGVGLGLPLVKQVMEGHDGRVEVRSVPKRGTAFTLWFPLLSPTKTARRRSRQAAHRKSPHAKPASSGRKR
jgi:signal transduction histidine kinase